MVIRAEDFLSRPREIFSDVLRFLGLRDWQPTDFVTRNRRSYAPIEREVRAQLTERLAEPNARLASLLSWDRTSYRRPPMTQWAARSGFFRENLERCSATPGRTGRARNELSP
jgi:hypothetical protein